MKSFKLLPRLLAGFGLIMTLSISVHALAIGLMIKNAKQVQQADGKVMMEFPILVSATPAVALTVNYVTSDGTAKAGKDYIVTSGQMTIPAGQKISAISVPLINDRKYSKDERVFYLSISSLTTQVMVAKAQAAIVDNNDTRQINAIKPINEKAKKDKK